MFEPGEGQDRALFKVTLLLTVRLSIGLVFIDSSSLSQHSNLLAPKKINNKNPLIIKMLINIKRHIEGYHKTYLAKKCTAFRYKVHSFQRQTDFRGLKT